MQKRILYYAGLGSLLLVWVVGQTPDVPAQPATAPAPVPPPVAPTPGASNTVPPRPKANAEASPSANGISPDGKMPLVPAGQKNAAVKAPNPNDICEFAFNFPKLNAEGLGYVYRQLTGRRVVMTAEVKDLEIYFVQPPPITYGEATDMLKAACLMHGFVFAPGGDGWDKLTTATQGPKPGTGDIPLITSPLALPETDEVVRYVMTLKYMKPDEVSRVFQAAVTQFNSFGSVVPVPNASALIITENTSLIRSLIELQAKIDVPSSNIETKFIRVQYGDVEELAATLNEIFAAQSASQTTAGVQRVQQGGTPPPQGTAPQAAGAASSSAGEAPPIQIVPDIRTNRIFVMARPLDLVFIESLVKEFDTPSDQRNFLRRKLKFLAVGDFLDVASDALSRAFGGAATSGGGGGDSGRASTSTTLGRGSSASSAGGSSSMGGSSRRSGGSSTNQFGGSGSSQFGGNGGGQMGAGGGGSGGLSAPQVATKPVSVLVGRTLLVADNITNSIVVQGPPAGVEIINNLLDEIDVKADQVMISTVFGQLTLSNEIEYGIDWFRNLDKTGDGAVAGKIGDVLPTFDSAGNIVTENKGLGVYGKVGEHLTGYLKALQATGDFNIISRPTIFTANNQKGLISSGQQISIPQSNQYAFNNNTPIVSYEYRDVVLALEVIPLVNSQDEITLQISLVSQSVGREYTDTESNRPPDIISRELLTTVTVPNNETVVLGGLITEELKKSISGVPILSQIPGLGKLFSTTSDKKNRNELVIFIQPKIIRDERSMEAANRDMDRRYEMSDKIREFDGPGVLPIKPVDEIPENVAPKAEPAKVTKPVSLGGEDADYQNAPKAKPVSESSFWDRFRK